MSSPDTLVQASAAGSVRPSRFRRWARRRARQFGFLVLICAGSLFVGACGVMIWRSVGLIGLPDIGDPFDVAGFRAFRLAEDQDAFVLLRQAAAKVPSVPFLPAAARRLGPAVGWSKADPRLRAWVEANRDALELFRKGADRPDGIPHPAFDGVDRVQYLNFGPLVWMALLEGSRLEEQGDEAGAWMWYRAVLRMRVHVMRRGSVYQRLFVGHICGGLASRTASWAADRRTDLALLHRALDDVRAAEPKAQWDSFSLKIDYLVMLSELNMHDGWVQQGDEEDRDIRIGGEKLPPNLAWSAHQGRRFVANEPERSRRLVRLIFANWLAHAEAPNQMTRKPVVRARILSEKQQSSLLLYAAGPDAPAGARALSPTDLASRLVKAIDAKRTLADWPWPSIRVSEQRDYRTLVVMLAEELYRREHGTPPPSEEALVGTYLDRLPGDGSDEMDDGTAPTVDDPRLSSTTVP